MISATFLLMACDPCCNHFVSQHAPRLGSGLAGYCEDLYVIALKANRRSGVALAGRLDAGLEPAEDLSSAIVHRRDNFGWRLMKSRADMPVCLRHSLLGQQQLGKIDRRLQLEQDGGLTSCPLD